MTALPADFPRPTKHNYEDDGHGFCAVCGYNAGGAPWLHSDPEPAFPEPSQDRDEAPICNGAGGCWHMRHDGPCRVSLSPLRSVPCPCKERAA